MGWVLVKFKELNKSELETEKIIKEGKEPGWDLNKEEARMIKGEQRIQKRIFWHAQGVIYIKHLEERLGTRGMMIILTAVIWGIQAKNPMPENPRAYNV